MTQGVARRQDLYQMMNAGLPIMRELESYTGKSGEALDKFISDGMVSAQVIDGV
ncbi:tape measure protein [Staphylococcus pasteuri_A]|uniref:tape measure protein n=1 Tax=Staphylococcus pasteuri_A TaxID=3062664 RepID=UPI0034C61429